VCPASTDFILLICDRTMTPRIVSGLVDIEQELFELPQKVGESIGFTT
jgi:hypothetical protein